ncbi:MAG: hypothetical protein LWW93_11180 [Hyphomicrobiales bacterium]|nr:hypothetical protein [Hyphomicrobiales bacterium]
MSDEDPVVPAAEEPPAAPLPPAIAGLALALLAALLAYQIIGSPLAALGGFFGGGLVAFLAWTPLVLRPAGVSIGGAAATGALALAAAYVGAGLVAGGGSRVLVDHDAAVMLVFTFWIVLPVMVAAAIGLAILPRLLGRR